MSGEISVGGTAPQPEWMFSFYQHPEDAPGSAQKRFQWCISPQALKKLKDKGCNTVQVFIITVDSSGAQSRQMVPLSDMQAFVQFRAPGPYWVHAVAIGMRDKHAMKQFRKCYLKRKAFGAPYELDVFESRDEDGRTIAIKDYVLDGLSYYTVPVMFDSTKVAVDVSDGQFAAPPPQWLAKWINLWQEPCVDTCEMRRRLPFALFVKPVLALCDIILGLVLLTIWWFIALGVALWLCVLCFSRGVHWRNFLTPWRWPDDGPNVFDTKSIGTGSFWKKYRGLRSVAPLLTPITQISLAGVTIVMTKAEWVQSYAQIEWQYAYLWVNVVLFTVVIAVDALRAWIHAPYAPLSEEERERIRLKNIETEARNKEFWERTVTRNYSDVVCGDQTSRRARAPQFTFSNPKPALTHWFQDIKANYCKPYAAD